MSFRVAGTARALGLAAAVGVKRDALPGSSYLVWITDEPLLKQNMIGLYSNRIGCLGSLVISIVATVLMALLLRACGVVAW
jgi:hypothetical protein